MGLFLPTTSGNHVAGLQSTEDHQAGFLFLLQLLPLQGLGKGTQSLVISSAMVVAMPTCILSHFMGPIMERTDHRGVYVTASVMIYHKLLKA